MRFSAPSAAAAQPAHVEGQQFIGVQHSRQLQVESERLANI